MANTPDDSRRPHPDENPHQPSPKTTHLGGPAAEPRSDPAIDLGKPAEEDVSGISAIEWAALGLDQPPSASRTGDPPAHRRALDPGETQLADVTPGSSIDLTAPGRGQAARPPESGSFVNLGADAVFEEEVIVPGTDVRSRAPLTGEQAAYEADAIDLGPDSVFVDQPPSAPPPSDVIDLGPDAIIDVPAGESGAIDLDSPVMRAAKPPETEHAIDLSADAVIDESAVDLGADALVAEEASASGTAWPAGVEAKAPASAGPGRMDSGVDLAGDDLLLERPATPAPSGSGSSRDLIAEELESGTDLLRPDRQRGGKKEEALPDDFLSETSARDDSSAVDLGSSPELSLFEDTHKRGRDLQGSAGGLAADSDVRLEGVAHGSGDYADVDVEGMEEATAKKGGKKAPRATIDTADMESLAAEEAAVEAASTARKGKTKPKPAAQAEDEDEAPKRKRPRAEGDAPRPRGRAGAWLGGTFLGVLVGAAACVGLVLGGVVPADWLGQPAPPPRTGGPGPGTGTAPPVQQPPPVTFEATLRQIRNGDLDQIKPEDLARADDARPDELVARAEYHWLSYLRAERGGNPAAPLRADAEPVKQALTDLDKVLKGAPATAPVPRADALFLRGQIHEQTGNAAAARADYQEGVKEFAAAANLKARFENALSLLELTARAMALPPGQTRDWLVALLVTLQAPAEKPAAPPAADEAGYRFWQALRLARAGQTAEAIKALDEARARHDRRRYLVPRKPQNPDSDPREEIFLRACDELKGCWAYQARLRNENYLQAGEKERIPEVDRLLVKAAEAARAEQLEAAARAFPDGKVTKVEDLVTLAGAERKKAAEDRAALVKKVDEGKKKADGLGDDLKAAGKKLDAAASALRAAQAEAKKARADGDAAVAALRSVGEAVGAEFTDLKTSRAGLLRAVGEAARTARMVDPRGTIKKLERDLAADRARLAQRWEPAEMLGVWAGVLQNDRASKDLADRARRDALRVLDDPASKDQTRARALLVRGLIERNAEDYAGAKETLTRARAGLAEAGGDWLARCDEALREVADPAADFARRARALEGGGRSAEAMAVLDRGVRSLPDRKGALLIQRAKTAFESARSKGALKAGDPLVRSARKDATDAAAEGLAEGHYLVGRIAEQLGELDEAARSYRAALKAHGKSDGEGSRYRIALARVLLKLQSAGAGTTDLGTRPPEAIALERAARRRGLSVDAAGVLTTLFVLQAGGLPRDRPSGSAEADRLADEILALGDRAPFDARAQALAIKGLHTRALAVYTAGLRDDNLLAAEYANTLLDLIAGHPALRRPESLTTPDPIQASRNYGAGLNFFFAAKYASAEKEFLGAVENDRADARYYYFLGLSRLAQGKRDAYEDFDQGARLEQQGKPGRAAVSTALERVQGRLRATLNEVRSRPAREGSR